MLAEVAGVPLRVHTWVDVLGVDRSLDPAAVGALLAVLHRSAPPARGPVDEWFTAPVGATNWSAVVGALRACGAPFVDRLDGAGACSDRRRGADGTSSRPGRLPPGPVGGQPAGHPGWWTDGAGLGERRPGRARAGAGPAGRRVRPRRAGAVADTARGVPRRRWPRAAARAPGLHAAARPAGADRPGGVSSMAVRAPPTRTARTTRSGWRRCSTRRSRARRSRRCSTWCATDLR